MIIIILVVTIKKYFFDLFYIFADCTVLFKTVKYSLYIQLILYKGHLADSSTEWLCKHEKNRFQKTHN